MPALAGGARIEVGVVTELNRGTPGPRACRNLRLISGDGSELGRIKRRPGWQMTGLG